MSTCSPIAPASNCSTGFRSNDWHTLHMRKSHQSFRKPFYSHQHMKRKASTCATGCWNDSYSGKVAQTGMLRTRAWHLSRTLANTTPHRTHQTAPLTWRQRPRSSPRNWNNNDSVKMLRNHSRKFHSKTTVPTPAPIRHRAHPIKPPSPSCSKQLAGIRQASEMRGGARPRARALGFLEVPLRSWYSLGTARHTLSSFERNARPTPRLHRHTRCFLGKTQQRGLRA